MITPYALIFLQLERRCDRTRRATADNNETNHVVCQARGSPVDQLDLLKRILISRDYHMMSVSQTEPNTHYSHKHSIFKFTI